jgi:hypothetical protein
MTVAAAAAVTTVVVVAAAAAAVTTVVVVAAAAAALTVVVVAVALTAMAAAVAAVVMTVATVVVVLIATTTSATSPTYNFRPSQLGERKDGTAIKKQPFRACGLISTIKHPLALAGGCFFVGVTGVLRRGRPVHLQPCNNGHSLSPNIP